MLAMFAIGLLAAAALVVFAVIGIYNRLVKLKNRFENAYAQIDVQLKRRYDLIPNLVETVKGYMSHERETLEAVIKARSGAVDANANAAKKPGDPEAMNLLQAAEGALTGALGRLMMLQENYPDLKADQSVMQLQEELSSTENRIAFARQAFNDAVMAFNTAREIFPNNIIAGTFNFGEASLFVIEAAEEKEAPKVSF